MQPLYVPSGFRVEEVGAMPLPSLSLSFSIYLSLRGGGGYASEAPSMLHATAITPAIGGGVQGLG